MVTTLAGFASSLWLACTPPNPGDRLQEDSGTAGGVGDSASDTDGPSDTGDTGEGGWPVFDCGDPPISAILVEVSSYYGVGQFYNNTRVSGNPWGWYLTADGANSEAATCDFEDVTADYFSGAEGAYLVNMAITMPAAYPPTYLGVYPNPAGFGGSRPGVSMGVLWKDADGELDLITTEVDDHETVLCLSRVRPNRVSGAFHFMATAASHVPDDYFVVFDFISEGFDYSEPEWWDSPSYSDGTCMLEAFYDFYDDPDDVWDPDFWSSSDDTGGDTTDSGE